VPPATFVERAESAGAHIIGLSTLMTTTMGAMSEVIRLLDEKQARSRIKVMVGGGPVSQQFANRIGADGLRGQCLGCGGSGHAPAPGASGVESAVTPIERFAALAAAVVWIGCPACPLWANGC